MINLMLGPPGGGKSYESVVFQILPALEAGRKVITNLPLNLAEFAKIDPRFPSLIELRTKSRKEGFHAFGAVEDYGDDWRDPQTGQGPLYAIDECHKPLLRGSTPRDVDEWYAEHRHEGADVLLMTQSYGKVSKAIVDLVQTVYRVKKMTAFGKSDRYIRKVLDGVRGETMSTKERKYEKRFFKLYKSHTRSVAAVLEADAQDVNPAYLVWMRACYVLGVISAGLLAYKLYHFFADDPAPKKAVISNRERTEEHVIRNSQPSAPQPPAAITPQVPTINDSQLWRLVGSWEDQRGRVYLAAGGAETIRINGILCKSPNGYVECIYRGERITSRTGEPQSSFVSVLAAGPTPTYQ